MTRPMTDPDIDALRNAIKRLRRWGQLFKWGGGYPSLVIADDASDALDRIEERLKLQQVELWEEK